MATLQILTDWLSPKYNQGIGYWALSTTFVVGGSRSGATITGGDIAPYVQSYNIRRGRSSDLDRPQTGLMTLVLDSPCGLFFPMRTDGILSGSLIPGRTISAKWTHSGSSFLRFTGKVSGYTTETTVGEDRVAIIECADSWDDFQRRETRSTLYSNITTGCLVGSILNNAEFPSSSRAIDGGQITLGIAHFDRRKIDEVLVDINQTEFGNMFIRGDGYFVFHDRNFRKTSSASATFTDNMQDVLFTRDINNLYTEVQVNVLPKVTNPQTTIWTLASPIKISHSSTASWWGSYIDPGTCRLVPAQSVASPVIGTEFLMNSNASGTGNDLSSNLTASFTAFAEAFKVVASNSGTTTGYVIEMPVTGCPIVSYETLVRSRINQSACSLYGHRILTYDAKIIDDAEDGDTLANVLIQRYSDPDDTDLVSVSLVNDNDNNLVHILRRDIDSRITLTASAVSISAIDYHIDNLNENWENSGLHKVMYDLSRIAINN